MWMICVKFSNWSAERHALMASRASPPSRRFTGDQHNRKSSQQILPHESRLNDGMDPVSNKASIQLQ